MSLFRVLETPLDVAQATAAVSAPEVGGIDVFLGVVRDHNAGRAVTRLEYHAYVSMAEKEMQRIAQEIARELPGVRLAALHRIGSL
ncbi:MAG TPA: molybdenum cofactor biosynthesis protein MoaE, partial [Polyangiaceae bacterium]|nr:molybdenum cofactor biosynthesis protein MoaE [Polyangiaceae bacterium]